MHFSIKKSFISLAALTIFFAGAAQSITDTVQLHTIVVFFDGLRPDYITPESMPNVYAFSKRGAYGKQHHSVYPTVTRVNASSYATGSYPSTHGLMGNTIYFPEVDKTKGLNTGEATELNHVTAATNGQLLTAVSVGEVLLQNHHSMMVFSSGSTGSTLLQNHTLSGGPTINPDMILPASFKEQLIKDIGPVPASDKAKDAQNAWVTDAVIHYALQKNGPLLSSVWFTNPDHVAHGDGIGSATAMASIKAADAQFGRIVKAIEERGLANYFNIIITADHGFVTHIGKNNTADFLISEGLKQSKESEDVVVSEGAIYVKNHDSVLIKKIVGRLQAQPWIGSIFTKAVTPGSEYGRLAGTLSFDAVHWNHTQRAADILVDYNWNDDKNSMGYAGTSYSRGVAGHGNFSPYEVHIALLASGPSFKKSYSSELPSSNIDIIPTILYVHHLPIPASMEGRVLKELLVNEQPLTQKATTSVIKSTTMNEDGVYLIELHRTILGKYKYLDYSKVTRTSK